MLLANGIHTRASYCSSLGQNLSTSTYIGEINFAVLIAILGLVLFALLIGNMQVSLVAGKGLPGLRKSSIEHDLYCLGVIRVSLLDKFLGLLWDVHTSS